MPKKRKSAKKKPAKPHVMKIEGYPVVNPTRREILAITARDIAGSKPKDSSSCAAAVAAMRQVPGCTRAKVHVQRTYLLVARGKKKVWLRYQTPDALRTEVAVFDRGGKMEPDEYEFKPVAAREWTGRRQGSNAPGARDRGSRDRTPSFKRPAHVLANVRLPAAKR
jgi:hypothetical protein